MKVFTAIELKNGAIDRISCFDTQLICDKFVDKWHSIYDINNDVHWDNDVHWEIKTFENETTDMSVIEALDEKIEYIKRELTRQDENNYDYLKENNK
jgi:hypothetical protein